jgi:hypothetical protein
MYNAVYVWFVDRLSGLGRMLSMIGRFGKIFG